MKDLTQAKTLLLEGGYTCALVCGDATLTTGLRGVKPLLQWLEEGPDLRGWCAADKVVGKAAAYLYVLLGVKAIHALVISSSALAVLEENCIPVTYDTCVEAIRNRTNTGFCPMEQAVMDLSDPSLAPERIRRTLEKLAAQAQTT